MTTLRSESPLRLLHAAKMGPEAWVFQSSYGGGFVHGDAVALDVQVGVGAGLVLATQSSTKVYRGEASQTMRAQVQGHLSVLPDPLVCYRGASYRQQSEIVLAAGASLVWLDWLTCGRRAFGERWAFASYDARLRIVRGGDVLADDRVLLEGDVARAMGRFDVSAVLWLVGVGEVSDTSLKPRHESHVSVSRLQKDVHCVRVCATDVEAATRAIENFVSLDRRAASRHSAQRHASHSARAG